MLVNDETINSKLIESDNQLNEFETEKTLRMQMDGVCGISQKIWNIIFALIAIIGQIAQNIILPIWFSSVPNANEGNSIDPYWICTSYSIFHIIFFGICFIIFDVFINKKISNIKQFNKLLHLKYIKKYLILAISDALSGGLIVFAARKCAPYLQTILGLFGIFWVIMFRYLLLKKTPTNLQFLYVLLVFIGLFLASVPSVFGLNSKDAFKTDGDKTWQILWPLLFALSSAPDAIESVATESVLKDTYYDEVPDDDIKEFSTLSIWWVLFIENIFQWIIWIPLFWVDALPTFGAVDDIGQIFDNLETDWRYMFGLENVSKRCIYLSWIFNIIAIITSIGFAMMIRYSEGATWAAIVNCLVSPISAMFWFLFELRNNGWFGWHPSWELYDLYAFAGLILMTPFVYLYHIEVNKKHIAN